MKKLTYAQVKSAIKKIVIKGKRPTVKQVCKILNITHTLDNAKVFEFVKEWEFEQKKSYQSQAFKSSLKRLSKKNKTKFDPAALLLLKQKVKKRNQALKQSLALVRATLESTADGILVLDQTGKMIDWNEKFIEILHVPDHVLKSRDEDVGLKYIFSQVKNPEALYKEITSLYDNPAAKGDYGEIEFKDGRIIERYSQPHRIDHEIVGRVWSFRDVTEKKHAEETLRLRERALESSTQGVIITTALTPWHINYVNPAFERITGYLKEEVIGKPVSFLQGSESDQAGLKNVNLALKEQREEQAIFSNYRKNGELFWNEWHLAPVYDLEGKVSHFVIIIVDITQRKYMEDQLVHQATHDGLTDLPNRSLLLDRLNQALLYAKRTNSLVAVYFLDLDRFKFVNDALGHSLGDELIRMVSSRLSRILRETDTIARIGGDEFVIICTNYQKEEEAILLAQKTLNILSEPFMVEKHQINITTSIGISFYPTDGQDVDVIMKNADIAMYQAKEVGRNNFQFYTAKMNQYLINRLKLESGLREALARQQFQLHYQPIINLQTGKIMGVEALLRWFHPELGLIPPLDFIPIAEETGLIVPIGEWIVTTACKEIMEIQKQGLPQIHVAINISAHQLKQNNFIDTIKQALSKSQLDPHLLELELTESILMENVDATIGILNELKKIGVTIDIDDFGTGYSSLSYLQKFPVQKLKIDYSFVKGMTTDNNKIAIVQTIIALCKNLKLYSIAEGVETKEQLDHLRAYGCDEGQGFYFSKALPLSKLRELLQTKYNLLR